MNALLTMDSKCGCCKHYKFPQIQTNFSLWQILCKILFEFNQYLAERGKSNGALKISFASSKMVTVTSRPVEFNISLYLYRDLEH